MAVADDSSGEGGICTGAARKHMCVKRRDADAGPWVVTLLPAVEIFSAHEAAHVIGAVVLAVGAEEPGRGHL